MIAYRTIADALLMNALSHLKSWCPGGHVSAEEYVALCPWRADKKAGSFRVNLHTGRWADFATQDRGRDLISLYAKINHLTNFEAARELSILCRIS